MAPPEAAPPPPRWLQPERLDLDPTAPDARKKFTHWLRTFTNYAAKLAETDSKLDALINSIGHDPYSMIETAATYDDALTILKQNYQKPVNQIYARHRLATRKQNPEESLDDYLRELKLLSGDCNFTAVTAQVYTAEAIRDAFIAGLQSKYQAEASGE